MHDRLPLPRRITFAVVLLAVVVACGTAGYMAIEGWGWFDSLYVTVTTLTTIGGGAPTPLSVEGKWWTIFVVVIGFGVLSSTLLPLVGYVLEGHLGREVGSRRMRRQIYRMRNHFILCGFGRVGGEIARDFTAQRLPFVIIDIKANSLERAAIEGYPVVNGNASDVAVLQAAGIERARGLITAIDDDADNIYVTLSARVLRPDIFIVARANRLDSEPKLRLAGANRIISPYTIGGRRMASLAMRPTAVDFVDTVLSAGNAALVLEDFTIANGSRWTGRPLSALTENADDVIILAVKRGDTMFFRPHETTCIEDGDEIVAAGPATAIGAMERAIADRD